MIEWFKNLSNAEKIACVSIAVTVVLAVIGGLFALFNALFNKEDGVTSHGQSGGVTAQNVTMHNYFDTHFTDTAAFHRRLKEMYPLGYAVFASDGKTVNVPDGLTYERDFEIKWANAKVYKLEADLIHFDLPDIVYKPTGNELHNVGFGFPRKVGYVTPLPFVRWKQSVPVIEVLADEGDFVVLLLGFKDKREPAAPAD